MKRVIAILGPTGSGKARLAVALARRLGLPILSCDSMKVYRGLDVGTAKPTASAREGVEWHGLDLVSPWERYDTNQFAELANSLLDPARPLILSGGTMLYLKAVTEGLGPTIPRDEAVRDRLVAEAQADGSSALHARLATVDPESAGRIHPNDERRIVRALEVWELSGRPLSSFHGQFGTVRPGLERTCVVVERERADMDDRIDTRIERMFERGWLEEARTLRDDPRGISREAAQALGYRQLWAWMDAGEQTPFEELVAGIQSATRRFARKQLTWLRRLTGTVHTISVSPGEEPADRLNDVLSWV